MMIQTIHHESHQLLRHILKFYLSRILSHHRINHQRNIIILIYYYSNTVVLIDCTVRRIPTEVKFESILKKLMRFMMKRFISSYVGSTVGIKLWYPTVTKNPDSNNIQQGLGSHAIIGW